MVQIATYSVVGIIRIHWVEITHKDSLALAVVNLRVSLAQIIQWAVILEVWVEWVLILEVWVALWVKEVYSPISLGQVTHLITIKIEEIPIIHLVVVPEVTPSSEST